MQGLGIRGSESRGYVAGAEGGELEAQMPWEWAGGRISGREGGWGSAAVWMESWGWGGDSGSSQDRLTYSLPTSMNPYLGLVSSLRAAWLTGKTRTAEHRISQLEALGRFLDDKKQPILDAMASDMHKVSWVWLSPAQGKWGARLPVGKGWRRNGESPWGSPTAQLAGGALGSHLPRFLAHPPPRRSRGLWVVHYVR